MCNDSMHLLASHLGLHEAYVALAHCDSSCCVLSPRPAAQSRGPLPLLLLFLSCCHLTHAVHLDKCSKSAGIDSTFFPAAALQHQDAPRPEVMAKMVEQAKMLESAAAETLQAALDKEQGHLLNGHSHVNGQLATAVLCVQSLLAPMCDSRPEWSSRLSTYGMHSHGTKIRRAVAVGCSDVCRCA